MTDKSSGMFTAFFDKMKKDKKFEKCVYLALAALVILLYFLSTSFSKSDSKQDETASVQVYSVSEADAEKRLAQTLSQIRGAGKVTVMITYDTGTEIVPAMSSSLQSSQSDTQGGSSKSETESNQVATITSQGEENPVVITEIQPKVRGVIVIAEGAADISVRMNLEHAAATVLGIDAQAIEVFEMKSE